MLLAEELALVALDPGSGRHALGTRENLNACLAGLLVAELHLDDRDSSPILDAASDVVDEAGPKHKSVLSAMSRSLAARLGLGTWDAVVHSLVDRGLVALAEGTVRRATGCSTSMLGTRSCGGCGWLPPATSRSTCAPRRCCR